jgi:hypothetical protein
MLGYGHNAEVALQEVSRVIGVHGLCNPLSDRRFGEG